MITVAVDGSDHSNIVCVLALLNSVTNDALRNTILLTLGIIDVRKNTASDEILLYRRS
jgi:hypothetical protein